MALAAIHERFSPAYGPRPATTAGTRMDVEFKFDDRDSTDGVPKLYVKQARPTRGG